MRGAIVWTRATPETHLSTYLRMTGRMGIASEAADLHVISGCIA